jgi:hypothetical protein
LFLRASESFREQYDLLKQKKLPKPIESLILQKFRSLKEAGMHLVDFSTHVRCSLFLFRVSWLSFNLPMPRRTDACVRTGAWRLRRSGSRGMMRSSHLLLVASFALCRQLDAPWACPACTFENVSKAKACEVCGGARPPPEQPKAAAASGSSKPAAGSASAAGAAAAGSRGIAMGSRT